MNWSELQIPEWVIRWYEATEGYRGRILNSLIILIVGLILVRILGRLFVRPWQHKMSAQSRLVARKAILYTVSLLVLIMVLREFDVQLTTLLGAAGIAGIAIGFAAQTSLSNIISGFFLLWEKPFQIGDVIRVGDQTGTVESIDLLSMTLRTFDNLSVRIPNETMVKNQLVNVTRHPIRRFDLNLGVAYKEDVDRVLRILRDVADDNPDVLDEPEPVVAFTGFGESQLNFFVGVWHEREDFLRVRTTILRDIKARFEKEGIQIPYPHRVVVTETAPAVDKAGAD